MKARIEKFKSGWQDIQLSLSKAEINSLIAYLRELESGQIQHFHLTTIDFDVEEGIIDIEISLKGVDEKDNMMIG